jgi:hypothetical protein
MHVPDATARGDRGPIGLIIVHGIGEPNPGDALADFTDSLAQARLASFDEVQRLHRLKDEAQSNPATRTEFFPAHVRRGATADGVPIVAAEVYWGSASQLAPGRLGVLHGIVSVMLNTPALIVGSDEKRRGTAGVLHHLAWAASMLLSGPAFALNALLLVTLAIHVAIHVVFAAPAAGVDRIVPWAAAAATSGLGFISWLWFPETRWAFWLAGPTCALLSLVRGDTDVSGFAVTTARALEIIIAAVVALLLPLVVVYVAGRLLRRVGRSSATAVLSACLQFGFWTVLVPLTWRVVLNRMPEAASEPWMSDLFARIAQAEGIQWLNSGLVVATLLIVALVRKVQQALEARRHGSRASARLILNPIVAGAVLAVTALGATVVLLVTVFGIAGAPGWVRWLLDVVPELRGTSVLLLVLPLFVKQIRLALDLAHDVIFYIHYSWGGGRQFLSRFRSGTRPGVNPVRSRFRSVVDHVRLEDGISRLIIVAHSQGSVIALDELAHSWRRDELPPGISLVTLGSPISHLYHHYFPGAYPDWKDPWWDELFARVTRWANFYRAGDYVGTTIDPTSRCQFSEQALGEGGHSNYWTDPRLLAALERWQLFTYLPPPVIQSV